MFELLEILPQGRNSQPVLARACHRGTPRWTRRCSIVGGCLMACLAPSFLPAEAAAQRRPDLPRWPAAAATPAAFTPTAPRAEVAPPQLTRGTSESLVTVPTADDPVASLLAVAFAQHPELSAADAGVQREAGERHQATRWPNPVIGYMASEIGQQGRAGQQGVYWSQEWITAGKLGWADQIGQWRVVAATADLEVQRLRLARRVQAQYWSLVAARQRVALLTQLEEVLSEAVRTNEALLQAEEIGRGTLLQARLELAQIVAAKRQANIDLQAKTEVLASTLNVSPDFFAQVADAPWPTTLPTTWPTPASSSDDALRAVSMQEDASAAVELEGAIGFSEPTDSQGIPTAAGAQVASPELAAARARWEAARCAIRLAEVQIVPNVSSQAAVQHDALSNDVIVSLQMGVALPLTDRKVGLVQAARAAATEAQAQYEATERLLLARLASANGQYAAARALVESIEAELLPLAADRLALARQAHQQGEIDYLELLTAQRSFLDLQQTALATREQAAEAYVRLVTLGVAD